MSSLNKVMVIGNVGRDPERRELADGRPVVQFSVAASRKLRPGEDGEQREETEWFTIVAFDQLAQICQQMVQKGKQVYVEGRLHTRSWDDQHGQKHWRTEVIAHDVELLGSRDRGPHDVPHADNPTTAPNGEGNALPRSSVAVAPLDRPLAATHAVVAGAAPTRTLK